MRRVSLLPILVVLPLLFAADRESKDPSSPPGAIRLIDGYRHERLQGIDSTVGRIWKEGGLEIRYDIGVFAGNNAASVKPADRLWAMSQVIRGKSAEIVKAKNGFVTVTFSSDPKNKAGDSPANFYAKVSNEEELAALLLITMTYPAAP
jgi:hypothetical protein